MPDFAMSQFLFLMWRASSLEQYLRAKRDTVRLAECTTDLYVALERFRESLKISGTINRDKMFYRLYDDFSHGPAVLLDIEILLPNDWSKVAKGQDIEIPITIMIRPGSSLPQY